MAEKRILVYGRNKVSERHAEQILPGDTVLWLPHKSGPSIKITFKNEIPFDPSEWPTATKSGEQVSGVVSIGVGKKTFTYTASSQSHRGVGVLSEPDLIVDGGGGSGGKKKTTRRRAIKKR